MPDETSFAEAFERLRQARGWSPAEVARQLGVYPTEVSRWRHGRGGISINNVRKVADLFGVDRSWLERLAGYGDSHSGDVQDTVDTERRVYRARYDYLMDRKVPRPFWESFLDACEALATVFAHGAPGELSEAVEPPLNATLAPAAEDEGPSQDPPLIHCYDLPRHALRNANFAPAG